MKEFIITEEELQKIADYIGKGTFYEVEALIYLIRGVAGRPVPTPSNQVPPEGPISR